MAACILDALAPLLEELAIGPWQPAQLEPYSAAPPPVEAGGAIGVEGITEGTTAVAATDKDFSVTAWTSAAWAASLEV
jgi:hypothetical protein